MLRIAAVGAAAPHRPGVWANRALWEETFAVEEVASATGAGDSCVAGLLAALLAAAVRRTGTEDGLLRRGPKRQGA